MLDPKTIARPKLIVALDLPNREEAMGLVHRLGDDVRTYKVGLEAYAVGHGDSLRQELRFTSRSVFVDLKIHDIPETVKRTVTSLAYSAHFTTVHAQVQVMEAAVQAVREAPTTLKKDQASPLMVLAVTVLTSLSDQDLTDDGYPADVRVQDMVRRRAERAFKLGVSGVVASPQEVKLIRQVTGPDFIIVCPGVRPAGADTADQKRVATPRQAIRDGADYVVVGRPIRDAPDPRVVADAVLVDIIAGMADAANVSSFGKPSPQ